MAILNMVRVVLDDPSPSGLDFSGLITALTGSVSAQQIITYIAGIVGAGLGLYVAWVFGRKAVSAFQRALSGKSAGV